MGSKGPVQIVMTVIKRRDLPRVQEIVKGFDEKVFYSVDDLHSTAEGVFPEEHARAWRLISPSPASSSHSAVRSFSRRGRKPRKLASLHRTLDCSLSSTGKSMAVRTDLSW